MKFDDLRKWQIIRVKTKNWEKYYLIDSNHSKQEYHKHGMRMRDTLALDIKPTKEAYPYFMGEIEWTEYRAHFGNAKLATEAEKKKLEDMNWLGFFIRSIFENYDYRWKAFLK